MGSRMARSTCRGNDKRVVYAEMSPSKAAEAVETCCLGHLEAAGAGHIHCLERLQQEGQFLGLGSPDRRTAGEARSAQAWEAADAACRANHSSTLKWILAVWRPSRRTPAKLWCLRSTEDWDFTRDAGFYCPAHVELPSQHEFLLYRSVIRSPTPACLEVLLDAGCRSPFL
eukprot:jgi/Botrbrau1/10365/Bobra.146_2s0004.1